MAEQVLDVDVHPAPAGMLDTPLATRLGDDELGARLGRIDELLERVEQVPGPTSDAAIESVQLLTEVYGEALARLLELAGEALVDSCTRDELLRHLMVLHDLHPDSVEQRVRQVLDEIGARVGPQGIRVELDSLDDGVARIRVTGEGGGGCGSSCGSSGGVDEALAERVLALAPELRSVEPVREAGAGTVQALIPVEALLRRPPDLGGPG